MFAAPLPDLFRDFTEDQLAHALQTDLPGAETEYSLRRQLEKYPKIIRSSIECSWGPRRCVPQS